MYFKLNIDQENYLLSQPETGMGYQVIEASKLGSYMRSLYIVLNSQLVVEMKPFRRKIVNDVLLKRDLTIKELVLVDPKVIKKTELYGIVSERKSDSPKGAIENPVEEADGVEVFVRPSAFEDDKRID